MTATRIEHRSLKTGGKDFDLRLGDWRECLADVEEVDALICDPPYGNRTHVGHDAISGENSWGSPSRRSSLGYSHWTADDVSSFVDFWHERVGGWIVAFSCSDLFPVWRARFEDIGRVAFAPVPCVIRGMSVRLSGDGPSNWAVYLNVARNKGRDDSWGTRVGAYVTTRGPAKHMGGKPLDLMRAIVRDYTRPGDLVCDPCAGYATTGIAAEGLGRRFIGAEIDPETHAAALMRRSAGVQTELAL